MSSTKRHAARSAFVPPGPAAMDLHTHTLRSDGLLTPAQLAAAAGAAGVKLLAITDHDTLAGVRELSASGEVPAGLEVVPGIEINTVVTGAQELFSEGEVHILGIGVDPDDDVLETALAQQRYSRRRRYDRMVTRLRELGMPIEAALETLPATTDEDALGRPRIARALIAAGHATSVEDAFNKHLSRGRAAYVPREGLGPRDAISAIRSAGGIASLAHYAEAPEHLGFLRELIDLGLNALECHYRAYDPDTVATLKDIASELGLIVTGGTDYHGDRETYAEAHAQLWVPDEITSDFRVALRDRAEASEPQAEERSDNERLIERYWNEVWGEGRLEVAAELYAPAYPENLEQTTPQEFIEGARAWRAHFADFGVEIDDIFSTERNVVSRVTIRGRHVADFKRVPATGRTFQLSGIDIFEIEDGRIVQHWHATDHLELFRQLGAELHPAPDEPAET